MPKSGPLKLKYNNPFVQLPAVYVIINNSNNKYSNDDLKKIGTLYIFKESLSGVNIDENLALLDVTVDVIAIGY